MEPQKPKTSAKDFFLNLGAIVALYTTIIALLNLLFTVINSAYPQITQYYYSGSSSISFPVATLIIFFPIYILLMWLLEKSYAVEPDKKHLGVRRWLTYITLFIAGLTLAGDLVTVIYYFLDGQELTTGFLLKVLAVLVVILGVFMYYISDIREKLSSLSHKVWMLVALVFVVASVVWGFAVIGSPRTQQLIKYDQQKISDLQNINSEVQNYYQTKNILPLNLADLLNDDQNYFVLPMDEQTKQAYGYGKIGDFSYQLCAYFNKASPPDGAEIVTSIYTSWNHAAGEYCFNEKITPIVSPTNYNQGVPIAIPVK